MRHSTPPAHRWLIRRVRVLCLGALALSLVLPIYVPDANTPLPTELEDETQGSFLFAEEGFLMKTSSLSEEGTRSAFTQGIVRTVQAGENLRGIAQSVGLKPETIRWANDLADNTTITPGQKLLILPVDGVVHKVKRGQNLSMIAELYSVSSDTIAKQNNLRGSYLLAGQDLIIPGGEPIVEKVTKAPVIAKIPPAKTPTTPSVEPKRPARDYPITVTTGIFQLPCNCFQTQGYHAGHYGIDLQQKGGGPIFAAEAGTVIRADYGWNGGYGNVIEIDHGNGLITLYGHHKELYVKKGDSVTRGQNIGYMGNTGLVHGPTGIHLHFEVHANGVKKNPMVYIKE